MTLQFEKRQHPSRVMVVGSPVLAILLTVIVGGILFAARGLEPLPALYVYFVEPVTTLWSIEELVVKATPLVLIGAGLAVCFRANVWNIGAEGQLTMGAIVGAAIPVLATEWQSPLVLPLMMALGIAGGMAWAAVPALLRNRFGANEILTSLMLVYVAQFVLDWLVRGPWRDPEGTTSRSRWRCRAFSSCRRSATAVSTWVERSRCWRCWCWSYCCRVL